MKDVSVRLTEADHGVYRLTARLSAPVKSATAWNVLTDYDGLGDIIPMIESSRVVHREGSFVIIDQTMECRFLFMRRSFTVRLDVAEATVGRIAFRDILGRDFRRFEGSWMIQPRNGGVDIAYELDAEPIFFVPFSLIKNRLEKFIEGFLENLRTEMRRRAHAGKSAWMS